MDTPQSFLYRFDWKQYVIFHTLGCDAAVQRLKAD
jgi:hypothetical protein